MIIFTIIIIIIVYKVHRCLFLWLYTDRQTVGHVCVDHGVETCVNQSESLVSGWGHCSLTGPWTKLFQECFLFKSPDWDVNAPTAGISFLISIWYFRLSEVGVSLKSTSTLKHTDKPCCCSFGACCDLKTVDQWTLLFFSGGFNWQCVKVLLQFCTLKIKLRNEPLWNLSVNLACNNATNCRKSCDLSWWSLTMSCVFFKLRCTAVSWSHLCPQKVLTSVSHLRPWPIGTTCQHGRHMNGSVGPTFVPLCSLPLM